MIPKPKPKTYPKIKRSLLASFQDETICIEAEVYRKPKTTRGRKGNASPALIIARNIVINGKPAPSIPHVCLAADSDLSEFKRVCKKLDVVPGSSQQRTFKAIPCRYGKDRWSLKVIKD